LRVSGFAAAASGVGGLTTSPDSWRRRREEKELGGGVSSLPAAPSADILGTGITAGDGVLLLPK
jgi:hypothetical protein